jgi:hypothetical protein
MQGVDESFGLQDVGVAEICEELAVRRRAAEAALRRLEEAGGDGAIPANRRDWLRQQYQNRVERLDEYENALENSRGDSSPAFRQLALELLQTERTQLELQAAEGSVSPTVAGRTLRDLQLREASAGGE